MKLRTLFSAALVAASLAAAPAFAQHGEEHAAPHAAAEHGTAEAHGAAAEHGADEHGAAEEHGAAGEHGGGEASAPSWSLLGSQIVNFAVYLGLLVMLGRKPAAAFFANRRAGITAAMQASRDATAAAEAELAATRARIARLDDERAAILTEFRELGEAERRRIVAQAEADATRIVRDAELAADREAARAKAELEARLVDLALSKARTQLADSLTPVSHAQLIDNGIDALRGAVN